MKSKSIFKSMTFWWNVLTVGNQLTQVIPLPPGVGETAVGVGNILIRLLMTKQPTHLIPPDQ